MKKLDVVNILWLQFFFSSCKNYSIWKGGIITTNNKDFYKKLISLRSHGMIREQNKFFNEDLKKVFAV